MEKRTFTRVPFSLDVRMFYGRLIYTGITTDLSENGMFISSRIIFPHEIEFLMVALRNDKIFKVPVRVVRTVKPESHETFTSSNGMGVKLMESPRDYLDFVTCCRDSSDPSFTVSP